MPSSFDGEFNECPYSQILRELDEAYSFVLDDRDDDEKYQRSNSVLLETASDVAVPVTRVARRSHSCEPKPRTIRWHDETEEYSPTEKPRLRSQRNNTQKEVPDGTKKSVLSFKRSLRLLGLSPTELGLIQSPDDKERCTTNAAKRRCCTGTPRPRLSTRLTRKSVSLDDVRKATPRMLSDADAHKVVANAVYEEWYFGKQSEILRKRREEEEEEKRKAEKVAMEKEELRRKSDEKFHEWLKRKLQQKRESQVQRATSAPNQRRFFESRQPVTPEQAADAYHKWLQEKEQQKRQEKRKGAAAGDRTSSRRQPDPERREEAMKVYQHWKKEIEEKKRKEQEEKRRKQEEEEKAKRQKEQEKQEDARRSFQHWKNRKDQEKRLQLERKRIAEVREEARKLERRWNRSETAAKAFLDWLDAVDERSNRATALRTSATPTCTRRQTAF